jgi:sporulation protein YlmC with PRC-barrel domain
MKLELLSQGDKWELVDTSKDLRGRRLLDSRGGEHGRVKDLVVNAEEQRVESVWTDTGERFPVESLEVHAGEVITHDEDAVPASTPMCGVMPVLPARRGLPVAGADLRTTTIYGMDGEVGKLSDIYFDDERWTIRYLVVRTSNKWLLGRKVLIGPDAILASDRPAERLNLNLTRDQIKHSPNIDTDRPVSRQQQNLLATYYGWPGVGIGMMPGAIVGPSYTYPGSHYAHAESAIGQDEGESDADPHLRSAREVARYSVHAGNETIGHMEDFVYNLVDTSVRYIRFNTGERTVQLPIECVGEIRWADRAVAIRRP